MKKKRLLVVGIFLVILIGIGIFFFSSRKSNSSSTTTTKDIDSSVNIDDCDSYSGCEDVDGVLFSHDDLTLDGEGGLIIKSNYKDEIVSKDDLKIINGNYIIDSSDDGIRGKDSVYILNGSFSIKCSGDGSSNSSFLNDNWGRWGSSYSTDTSSAKGLKSVDNLVISGGTFTFDTSDDSIHSNNYVGVSDGVINISSGDDAIHADLELVIDGGVIKATKSYEGLEASKITINGGDISVTSSDDGINVAGGNDSSSMNRPGENTYADSDNTLIINGGSVIVNASGDGIDVNGNGYINGGTTMVYGPSNGGNGALDYDRSFEINGGLFMAGGSSGMAQGATNGSKQNNVMINFTQTYSSGDVIVIVDSNNNEVMSYSSDKSYSSLVLSSSKLESNKTYTIKVNGNKYDEFTVNSVCNSVGSSYGGMNGGASHSGGRR